MSNDHTEHQLTFFRGGAGDSVLAPADVLGADVVNEGEMRGDKQHEGSAL